MAEGAFNNDIVRIEPDLAGAVLAVHLASQMLDKARENLSRKDYLGALEESRNAMRIASSALMLRDGNMAGSLEATMAYLSSSYPGRFPLRSWYVAETAMVSKGGGLYGTFLGVIGRAAKSLEQEANDAINAADLFLDSVRMEMGQ